MNTDIELQSWLLQQLNKMVIRNNLILTNGVIALWFCNLRCCDLFILFSLKRRLRLNSNQPCDEYYLLHLFCKIVSQIFKLSIKFKLKVDYSDSVTFSSFTTIQCSLSYSGQLDSPLCPLHRCPTFICFVTSQILASVIIHSIGVMTLLCPSIAYQSP